MNLTYVPPLLFLNCKFMVFMGTEGKKFSRKILGKFHKDINS